MKEIETSNRLYEENGALYMTATVVVQARHRPPESVRDHFILTGKRLVTNRYVDPQAVRSSSPFVRTHPAACTAATPCSPA